MISKYKFSETIESCPEAEIPEWVDLADPDESELDEVSGQYRLARWLLTDPLDPRERPRVAQDETALLLVVRLSVRMDTPDGPAFRTVPVGVILAPGLVITVCRQSGLVEGRLRRLFARKRRWTRARLAFALFLTAATGFIENIETMEDLAAEAEARLRLQPENEELMALLNIEKSLIDTTIALKSNHALMDKFRQPEPFGLNLSKEEREILDDAMTENQQGIFMVEIFGQVLGSMGEAFGSVISNNLNKTMKFLAGVTIVLMLPTIIAGLYGMNVSLPGSEVRGAFIILCVVSLIMMLAVSVLFARKRWF